MSIDVVLPSLGESVTEATISRWLKAIGDDVTRDEPILEISTDKVDTEIPAPASGVLLEILFNEDDTANVGDVVAIIGTADSQTPVEWPAPVTWPLIVPPAPAPQPTVIPPAAASLQHAAPLPPAAPAQPLAATPPPLGATPMIDSIAQHLPSRGYDELADAHPMAPPPVPPPPIWRALYPDMDDTGPLPRVEDDDNEIKPATHGEALPASPSGYVTPMVRQMADDLGVDLTTVPGSGVGGRIRKQDLLDAVDYHVVTTEPASAPPVQPDPRRGTTHALSRERAAQADMVAQTSRVALSVGIEADVTALRARLAKPDEYLGDVLAAVAATLRAMAELNASVINDTVVYHDRENIGLVISTADGPLTPVIHGAGELTAAQLGAAASSLEARAIAGTLTPSELAAGTFTVHDGGPSGVAWSIPAINRPQVAALSIGQVSSRPVVVEGHGAGRIASRDIVWLTLSYDRRVIDPDMAASFLSRLRDALAR